MRHAIIQLIRRTWAPVVVTALCAGAAVADDFSLNWFTTAGGGATFSTGGDFSLGATIGQPATDSLSGGDFTLDGGFWRGVPLCTCLADMSNNNTTDGRDVRQFVQCLIAPGGNCMCADMNGDFQVTTADISLFVTKLLNGTTCP